MAAVPIAVTVAPLWVSVPPQNSVIVCPLAKGQVSVQLVAGDAGKAAVPLLLMTRLAPKPLVHWLPIV
jgi:hypothetical protein